MSSFGTFMSSFKYAYFRKVHKVLCLRHRLHFVSVVCPVNKNSAAVKNIKYHNKLRFHDNTNICGAVQRDDVLK